MTMVRMKVAAGGTKQQPTPLWRRWRRWRMMTALVDDDDDDETAR
jgi:predicted alpha/beta hydrolase